MDKLNGLMEIQVMKGNMKEKLKIGNQMELEILLTSLELSMLGNGRMVNIMVKEHLL